MSKIALSGNASGTGTLTLSAPNTNTDRTLTLPDSTGTILNDQSNIETQVKTATNATGSAPVYSCRAWVNFIGTGTVAIRASGNVSSITDLDTGSYNINFTTSMPDTDYCATTGYWYATNDGGKSANFMFRHPDSTVSTCRVTHLDPGVAAYDVSACSVAVFR